jgi:hypothetical protein
MARTICNRKNLHRTFDQSTMAEWGFLSGMRERKMQVYSHKELLQCSHCHHQTSATSGTIFHSTKLPLVNWFWAIYLVAADKGGISALRLSKHIGVSWVTAHRMLRKIRMLMAQRDSIYRLKCLIECDDPLSAGKWPVSVAEEVPE